MGKEDFLKNAIKERIINGLQINYLGYVANKEELVAENNVTLTYLQDESKMNELINILIDNAKLECQNTGKIPGNKEILSIIDITKARNFAVDFYKSTK